MAAADTAAQLTEFARRGAGSDAERRAAVWLRSQADCAAREATIEAFWCRPNWALAHAWHVLLALTGSLVMVSHARLGGALVLVSLVSTLADARTGRSLGRRLTLERASQNVVARPRAMAQAAPGGGTTAQAGAGGASPSEGGVRLIVTANYDAGRTGLAYRRPLRAAARLARRVGASGRLTPGWLGWLVILELWLLAVALARETSASDPGTAVAIAQLVPTVALIGFGALLAELAVAGFGPAAGDNAAGAAVALALVEALDTAPLRRLAVELVLQGAGDGQAIGLDRHLRARRRELSAETTVVLGLGPVGGERPCWWCSDGQLVPLGYHRGLRRLAADLTPTLGARPHRGRGTSSALPARRRGLPAITLGCLGADGSAPRSHRPDDVASALPERGLDELLQFALRLADTLDADLAANLTDPAHPAHPGDPGDPTGPGDPDPADPAAPSPASPSAPDAPVQAGNPAHL